MSCEISATLSRPIKRPVLGRLILVSSRHPQSLVKQQSYQLPVTIKSVFTIRGTAQAVIDKMGDVSVCVCVCVCTIVMYYSIHLHHLMNFTHSIHIWRERERK